MEGTVVGAQDVVYNIINLRQGRAEFECLWVIDDQTCEANTDTYTHSSENFLLEFLSVF